MRTQSHLFWYLSCVYMHCLVFVFLRVAGFGMFYFFGDIIDVLATPMIFGIAWISRCLICCGLEGYEEGKNETEEMTRDGFGRIRTDLEMLLVLGNGTPRTDDLSRIETDPA